MISRRFLVTGALGCIGSWVIRNLVQQGIGVTAYDLDDDPHRMQLIMTEAELAQVAFAKGDITDLPSLMDLAESAGITDIIHLAELQVPACKANPALGARVNVVGIVNVFEVARRLSLKRVVYASSVATYDVRDEYAGSLIQPDDPLNPVRSMGSTNRPTKRLPVSTGGITVSAASGCAPTFSMDRDGIRG